MKGKIYLYCLLCCALVLIYSGCYQDVISPGSDPNGPPAFVSFSGDLIPIFNTHCNGSGCHDATPSHAPSLVPDKAYNALMSGGMLIQRCLIKVRYMWFAKQEGCHHRER
jgi:hypothetical protein